MSYKRAYRYRNEDRAATAAGCSCGTLVIGWIVLNVILGGITVNYTLESFFGKTVEFWIAAIAGLFLGQFTVPIAIVCWLLRAAGIDAPFFPQN